MRDDARIAADCRAELDWDPALDAGHVEIDVARGIVTLGGWVPRWPDRRAAARAVSRLRGVRGVLSSIVVRLPESARRADDEIAARARQLLAWRHRPLADAVRVAVVGGCVTLDGIVDCHPDRAEAERCVGALEGVVAVECRLAVRPRVSVDDVRADLRRALQRRAGLDAATISITTVGHTVLLTGRVHDLADREAAEQAAWSAPGVTAVEVHIEVGSETRPETGA